VEPGAIVEFAVGELLEVLDRVGHFLVEQLGLNSALAGGYGRGLGHVTPLKNLAIQI
jgi:hypothetical protein